jgi:hypothetical protein
MTIIANCGQRFFKRVLMMGKWMMFIAQPLV